MRMAVYPYGQPLKSTLSQSNHEENVRRIPVEGYTTKYVTDTLQNCQSHQKQGKAEKLSQPKGSQGDVTIKHTMVS